MESNQPILVKKILVVGPAWVGDMVIAQALFRLLKQNNPQSIIDVLAPKATMSLLARMPEVTNSILAPFAHGKLSLLARYKLGKQLRHQHYDQAIVIPNSFKSALVPFWAKIPLRTGWRGEMRWGLLNDLRILDKNKLPQTIQRYCALGLTKDQPLPDKLPWPVLRTDAINRVSTLNDNKKILAICPGAAFGPSKCWPVEYFAELATAKIAEGWQVWIFGGPNDQPSAEKIQQLTNNGCRNLVGKTTLIEAIDLLAVTTIAVGNDSGLMHISAALQKPVIIIYGSTPPDIAPPLAKLAEIIYLNLPCSPCFKRQCPLKHFNCMRNIKPQTVITAVNKLISCEST